MYINRHSLASLCFSPDDNGGAGTVGEGNSTGGNGGAGTSGEGNSTGGDGGAGAAVELPKSQEELTKLIKEETAKTLKVSQEEWQKDFKAKLEIEKAEATRIAKLTGDEKEKEIEKKKKEELDQREATIRSQEIALKATEMLTEKGLPLEIRNLVIGKDEADTKTKIEAFEGVFQKAVEAAVNQKLSGGAKPGSGSNNAESDSLRAQIAAGLRG